jgi:drug/metabolite transporter (DMT)-like permease
LRPNSTLLAYLALVAALFATAVSSLFIRWSEAPGTVTTFYRMLFAGLLLTPLAARHAPASRSIRPALWLIPALGGLFTALDQGILSTALAYTSIANATLINNLAPLWVALFAWLAWRQRLTARFWWGLALTLAGAAIVLGRDVLAHPQLGRGDFLALLSSLGFAGYFLVGQSGRRHLPSLPYLWVMTLSAAACLLLWNGLRGLPLAGFSARTWWVFLGAALVSQSIGHFAFSYALGHLPASAVSSTAVLQPVIAALLAIPLAGEPLVSAQIAGGAIVLAGIYLVNRRPAEPDLAQPPAAGA